MKGFVKRKCSPADGPPAQSCALAASHTSVESVLVSGSTTEFVLLITASAF